MFAFCHPASSHGQLLSNKPGVGVRNRTDKWCVCECICIFYSNISKYTFLFFGLVESSGEGKKSQIHKVIFINLTK